MNNDERLRRSYDQIYDHYSFFATFVMEWKKVWVTDVPYAATDGPTLYLNPEWMATLDIAETLKVVKHEASHVFLGHMYRVPLSTLTDENDRYEWNLAMDLSANDLWITHDPEYGQINRPDGKIDKVAELLIFPGRRHAKFGDDFLNMPRGKTAEFYHDIIKKEGKYRKPQPQPSPGQGQGQGASQPGQSTSQGSGQGNSPSDSQKGSPSQTGGKPSTGSGDKSEAGNGETGADGSENGNLPNYSEQALRTDRPTSFGDVLPHPVVAENEGDEEAIEEAVEEWKQKVAQAVNNARSIGNLPGWVEELGNQIYGQKSTQNWRAHLRRFMTRVVSHGGQTYDKPNRRQSYRRDIVVPANRSRQASSGCILVDTSGSMSADQCNQALAEIEGILTYFPRCDVDLIMADTRLIDKSKKTFHRSDFPLRLPTTWLGRGGTDLCQPILGVAENRKYKWMVCISDMEWSADRAINPKIPCIFVWTPRVDTKEPYSRANFGTMIGPVLPTKKVR